VLSRILRHKKECEGEKEEWDFDSRPCWKVAVSFPHDLTSRPEFDSLMPICMSLCVYVFVYICNVCIYEYVCRKIPGTHVC
jgi:hypothetical protein